MGTVLVILDGRMDGLRDGWVERDGGRGRWRNGCVDGGGDEWRSVEAGRLRR